MQSHVENDFHEDVSLKVSLNMHALDVLIDKHENIEMSSQCKVYCGLCRGRGGLEFSKVHLLVN